MKGSFRDTLLTHLNAYIAWAMIFLFRHKMILALVLALAATPLRGQVENWLPDMQATIFSDPAPGYIFLGLERLAVTGDHPSSLVILDRFGEPVWLAVIGNSGPPPYRSEFPGDFKPIPGQRYSFSNGRSGKWYVLDREFILVDSVFCTQSVGTDLHDILFDEQGNKWLLCDTTAAVDMSAYFTTAGAPGSNNCTLLGQLMERQDADGQRLNHWNGLEHFPVEDADSLWFSDPAFFDYQHQNSVTKAPFGRLLLSSRHLNEVTLIDPESGQIVWRLGGKSNQFTLIGDSVWFGAQHDARIDADNRVYLYDNATLGPGPVARYVEYQLDTLAMTATLIRQYPEPSGQRSRFMGNANRLPGGHVITNIGYADDMTAAANFTEFDSEGKVVFQLDLEEPYFSYRIHKQELDQPLDRPNIECDAETGRIRVSSEHLEYRWNTGATSREISVDSAGVYRVWIPQGIGWLASEPFVVEDTDAMCKESEFFYIEPNPFSDQLHLDWNFDAVNLRIVDAMGRVMLNESIAGEQLDLDTKSWAQGIYFVQLQVGKIHLQRKLLKIR